MDSQAGWAFSLIERGSSSKIVNGMPKEQQRQPRVREHLDGCFWGYIRHYFDGNIVKKGGGELEGDSDIDSCTTVKGRAARDGTKLFDGKRLVGMYYFD